MVSLVFYQHSSCYLKIQSIPVQHIPQSEAQLIWVVLDLTGMHGVVPHVDIRYHANKRLINIKFSTIGILFLRNGKELN